jgi:hypothetical protein
MPKNFHITILMTCQVCAYGIEKVKILPAQEVTVDYIGTYPENTEKCPLTLFVRE